MKFLLVVLAIHFVAELVGHKNKNVKDNEVGGEDQLIRHPAEFELR
jgi:hypothetical protein